MNKGIYHILCIVIAVLAVACTGAGVGENGREPQPSDTLYTEAAAMAAHASQPGSERALLIIDSAEIVGNLQPYDAQFLRARVYSQTYDDMRLDSAIVLPPESNLWVVVRRERLLPSDNINKLLYAQQGQPHRYSHR